MRRLQFAAPTLVPALLIAAIVIIAQSRAEGEFCDDLDWVQVRHVVIRPQGGGTRRFDVTVEHNDEQLFTRSASGIRIPADQTSVLVRARCTDHGYEGHAVLVDLTVDEGEYHEIRRQILPSRYTDELPVSAGIKARR